MSQHKSRPGPASASVAEVFTEFHVPVGEVNEMLPAFVLVQSQIDLNERTPLGPLGLANEMHARLLRRVVGFAGVAGDAGADNVLPCGGTAAVAGNDVIEIQILAVESLAAVLAHVVIALENIMPGELDFLFGEAVEHDEQNDAGNADFEGDGADAFRMRLLFGKVLPLIEAVGLERAVLGIQDHLGMAFKEQSESAARGADINRLPQSVQDQHMLI